MFRCFSPTIRSQYSSVVLTMNPSGVWISNRTVATPFYNTQAGSSHATASLPTQGVRRVALSVGFFLPLSRWWPVVSFWQVAELGQTARIQRTSFLSLLIPVAVCSNGLWVGCPIVGASKEDCFIVRLLRAQGHPPIRSDSQTGHFSSFHAISQNIHS